MQNVREIALDLIDRVLGGEGYSNLALSKAINEKMVEGKDIGLLTELVYGTVQYKLTLDYYLEPFIEGKRINHYVRNNLRMAIYQMAFLDKIPPHAIVNEAVEIAKVNDQKSAKFVNGVLREVMRTGIRKTSDIEDPVERLSIETSHPLWLVKLWSKQYGFELAENLCRINQEKPYQFARLNRLKGSVEDILKRLDQEHIDYHRVGGMKDAIYLTSDNIAYTPAFKLGYVTVQDVSSQCVGKTLDPKKGEKVLDCCAAPGGKSTHLAELMDNEGTVVSLDVHEHKMDLIRYNARRLGTSIVQPMVGDATKLTSQFKKESFDRVLVDAPCTGFGVMRRKPEIKYNRTPQDLDAITILQKSIIDEAVQMVKPGGRLVYSTCTVNKKENEKMVEYLLKTYKEYELDPTGLQFIDIENEGYIQIIDQFPGADVFFISCFRRK